MLTLADINCSPNYSFVADHHIPPCPIPGAPPATKVLMENPGLSDQSLISNQCIFFT